MRIEWKRTLCLKYLTIPPFFGIVQNPRFGEKEEILQILLVIRDCFSDIDMKRELIQELSCPTLHGKMVCIHLVTNPIEAICWLEQNSADAIVTESDFTELSATRFHCQVRRLNRVPSKAAIFFLVNAMYSKEFIENSEVGILAEADDFAFPIFLGDYPHLSLVKRVADPIRLAMGGLFPAEEQIDENDRPTLALQ